MRRLASLLFAVGVAACHPAKRPVRPLPPISAPVYAAYMQGKLAGYRGDINRPVRQLAYAAGIEVARDIHLIAGDPAAVALLSDWEVPELPLKGGDIVARGVAAGPEVARILKAIEADWVAEDFPGAARVAELVDQKIGRTSD